MKTFTLTHARDGNVHSVIFSAPDFETATRDVLAMKEERGIRPISVKERVTESWVDRAAMLLGASVIVAVALGPTAREVWESGGSWARVLNAVVPLGVVVALVVVARLRAPRPPYAVLHEALQSGPPAFNGKARVFLIAGLAVGVVVGIAGLVSDLGEATEGEIKRTQMATLTCLLAFLAMSMREMWPKAPQPE